MSYLEKALSAIQHTEAGLKEIVAEAAEAGDYTAVMQIAAMARAINEMAARSNGSHGGTPDKWADVSAKVGKPKAKVKKDYPVFGRRGDVLVRVGWSKAEKREYEHKASTDVLDSLFEALQEAGADGKVFTTSELLPLHFGDGTEIPTYQLYAWLGFLNQAGLLDQHGRRGYSIVDLGSFESSAMNAFKSLPKK